MVAWRGGDGLVDKEKRTMIQVGDQVPDVAVKVVGAEGVHEASVRELTRGKRVVIFAVPGAFTPTCSQKHLPDYVEALESFREKGVDEVMCLSVNDPFVMEAWGKVHGTGGKLTLLADGNAAFTQAMGLTLDASAHGMGVRSQRYSMLVKDGYIEALLVEPAGAFGISAASCLLEKVS